MTAATVANALGGVYDPELEIDIVSLGLVYAIDTSAPAIVVQMTLTSSQCPLGMTLLQGAHAALTAAFPGREILVQVVDDPPWCIEMVSADARTQLGLDPLG